MSFGLNNALVNRCFKAKLYNKPSLDILLIAVDACYDSMIIQSNHLLMREWIYSSGNKKDTSFSILFALTERRIMVEIVLYNNKYMFISICTLTRISLHWLTILTFVDYHMNKQKFNRLIRNDLISVESLLCKLSLQNLIAQSRISIFTRAGRVNFKRQTIPFVYNFAVRVDLLRKPRANIF